MDAFTYNVHPWQPAEHLGELPEVQQALTNRRAHCSKRTLRQTSREKHLQPLREDARRFLHLASLPEHKYEPVHILFRHMGTPPPASQLAIIKAIERLNLAEFIRFRAGKSFIRLKELTGSGRKFLRMSPKSKAGKGGPIHTHICHWIQDVGIKRVYEESVLEWLVVGTNHFSDIGFKINGQWHTVEVVVDCFSNITDHVKACFIESNAIATLTIVTTQKSLWSKVEAKIFSDPDLVFLLNRIKFEVAETYMKELWP